MIKKELFDIYNRFHNEKRKVAEDEIAQINLILTNMGIGDNLEYLTVNITYEEDLFNPSDSIHLKYDFELKDINVLEQVKVNVIDNYFIKKYGKDNIRTRDIHMDMNHIDFEYLIVLYEDVKG